MGPAWTPISPSAGSFFHADHQAKDLAVARAMLQDPGITVLEVARRLGVAASTLYHHLPRARTAALDA